MSDWPSIHDDAPADDAGPAASPAADADDRLRRRHIDAVVAERRAVDRRQTWRRVALAVAVVAAIQAAIAIARPGPAAWTRMAVSLAVVGVGLAIARRLRPGPPVLPADPLPPPDFAGLGDGSQVVRNLERLSDEDR